MGVFIIAEIGINHNGDIGIAKRLIDMAVAAGCDAVKFQKRTIDVVYTPETLSAPRESPWGTTQREQKEGLEFGEAGYDEIDRYCREKGIIWFASAWDEESQRFLAKYHLQYNKVASAMLTNIAFLEVVARERRHTFISTGMSSLDDIDRAVAVFEKAQCPYSLLHCVSTYPSGDAEINLAVMDTLRERYGCEIGYSGHEADILASIVAVSRGAAVIERHITLDRTMYGSDQAASLEAGDLEAMVSAIRRIPVIMGAGEKTVSEREAAVAKKLRYFTV
ncbi:MAG: N-acetylneuraminate synthase [Methanomicrobiales archaeon]|nr:N-acetylneuraminate synthase [Methanomicrobiales archaeon]